MKEIYNKDIFPGQWIDFIGGNLEKKFPGPFKVLERDDFFWDSCRCYFMDQQGKLVDYCPRMKSLNGQPLSWDYQMMLLSDEEVEKLHPIEELRQKALEQIKHLAQYNGPGRLYNPDDESKTMSRAQAREKYGIAITE